MNSSRRKFLQIAATAAVVIAADGILYEPNRPRLVQMDVPIPSLPDTFDGFRIAQLSDFHYDEIFSSVPIRRAVDMINTLKPDVVALTGDFITVPPLKHGSSAKNAAANIEPCAQVLSRLHSEMGSFAVLGNHDVGSDVGRIIATLEASRIVVLRNGSLPLERMGRRIWLSGIDDVLAGRPDLERTLHAVPHHEPVILLAHEPDCADRVSRTAVALQLSGHSHGGQVRLPIIGPLYLPPLARKYPWGFRRIGNLALYTNVGIGTIGVPVRFNCRPEITLLTLRQMSFGRTQASDVRNANCQ
jgi:predicted MPP superfamily phosphohydrolase